MSNENQPEKLNEVIVMNDLMICAEVTLEDCEIPHETFRFGNLSKLTEVLSDDFLEKFAKEKNASSAYINNIYFRAREKGGVWRTEFRIGNRSEIDLESVVLKEEK